MRLTFKQLEYFVATADTGSIKHAAQKISISAPSISSAITQLESEFGVQLFVRQHAQGLTLTSTGQRFAREAKRLLRNSESLYDIADELRNEIGGSLNVGCMVTLAPMIAPRLIKSFNARHPNVTLSFTDSSHEQMVHALRHIEIDAAICYDLGFPDDVSFEPLDTLPPHVLVAEGHEFASSASVTVKQIAQAPFILLDLPYSREYFTSIFREAGVTPKIGHKSPTHELVRSMVANGFGYTIANVRPRNQTTLDGRKLKAVRLAGQHKPMTIGLATLSQEIKPLTLRTFETHCRKAISNGEIPGMRPQ